MTVLTKANNRHSHPISELAPPPTVFDKKAAFYHAIPLFGLPLVQNDGADNPSKVVAYH